MFIVSSDACGRVSCVMIVFCRLCTDSSSLFASLMIFVATSGRRLFGFDPVATPVFAA